MKSMTPTATQPNSPKMPTLSDSKWPSSGILPKKTEQAGEKTHSPTPTAFMRAMAYCASR